MHDTKCYDSKNECPMILFCRLFYGKGRDLTQSYDKSPYTNRKFQTATWQQKNSTKTYIAQRLRTDLGRSVWVTTAIKSFYRILTFLLTAKAVLSSLWRPEHQQSTKTERQKFKKRLLLRCIHHFKSDLINNMDYMRISGTEPSSVILN